MPGDTAAPSGHTAGTQAGAVKGSVVDPTIKVERVLRGDGRDHLRAFEVDPLVWLPELSRPGATPDAWQVYLWGGEIGMLVDLRLGEPERDGAVTSRSVRWRPRPGLGARQIPHFEGELGLRLEHDRGELLLQGRYHPPWGPLGVLADRLVLRRLASATLRQLLSDIRDQLHHADRDLAIRSLRERLTDPDQPEQGPRRRP